MDLKWFENHLAYTISKYDMSMIALGLSAELKNTMWLRMRCGQELPLQQQLSIIYWEVKC